MQLIAGAAEGAAPERGYEARACGFDLDDDGIHGEPADCQICNASLSGGLVSGGTTDPDGDGILEDLLYVDCDAGSNQANCGAQGQPPCRTIEYAFNTRADGPSDGAEDIVCFRGTCSEPNELTPAVGGVPGFRTKPRAGSEEWDFQFPTNPAMLVGWDTDGDGRYPPFDTDDTAVMDGNPDKIFNGNGVSRTFKLNNGFLVDNSYFEMGHFVVEDYGVDDTDTKGGFMSLNGGLSGASHLYLHDLSLLRINKDRPGKSLRSTFNWFSIQDYSYIAVINVEAVDHGGYFNRGAGNDSLPDAGPTRFQNISFSAHSCDFTNANGQICPDRPEVDAFSTAAKIWGYVSKFEWLDSIFDANVDDWIPRSSGGVPGAGGIGPAQCAQDWVIRNNHFIDYKVASMIQVFDPVACNNPGRPVTGIIIDSNIYTNDYDEWAFGHHFLVVAGNGPTELRTSGDLTFTNNFISSSSGIESVFDIRAGNENAPNPGTIVIANNTAHVDMNSGIDAAISLTDQGVAFGHDDFVIKNNIFTGVGPGDLLIRSTYAPSMLDSDRNVFEPQGQFVWNNGSPMNLSSWRAQTGADGQSAQCVPAFADIAGGDLHLQPTDVCAIGWGSDMSAYISVDIDTDPRGDGAGWEIGADEFVDTNTLPAVNINSPFDQDVFSPGETIVFNGTAFDLEDGDISAGLQWSTDQDGDIGGGGSFSTTLSAGGHEVTAAAIDSGSLIGFDTVHVTVTCPGPNALNLTDEIVTDTRVEVACTSITASGYEIWNNGDVTFRAGASIALTNGFEIRNGGSFTAEVDAELLP